MKVGIAHNSTLKAKIFFFVFVLMMAQQSFALVVSESKYFYNSNLPTCGWFGPSSWNQCKGKFEFPNGNIYIGEWSKGAREGIGQLRIVAIGTSDSSSIRTPEPSYYFGEFKDNKLNGHGVIILDSGARYEGDFANNVLIQQKVVYSKSRNISDFISHFPACTDDSPKNWNNCVGELTFPNGNTYIGEWRNGLREGFGQIRIVALGTSDTNNIRTPKPSYYIGQFLGNRLNGHGVIIFDSGEQIEGDFVNNIYSQSPKVIVTQDQPNNQKTPEQKKEKPTQEAPSKREPFPSGTGFFVANNGLIVTNWHVVEHANSLIVETYGKEFKQARLIGYDVRNDLAVLKVDTKSQHWLPIVKDSSSLPKGEEVIAVGFPRADLQGFEAKVTNGIISSLSGIENDPRTFQITVPVQPGNSGGPLVSRKGLVVGVVSSKLNAMAVIKETGSIPENVNYAIKSNYLLELLRSDSVRARIDTKGSMTDLSIPEVSERTEKATVLIWVN
jgi:S1-C subfamily serine protease